MKLRMPHLPGCDFRTSPQAECFEVRASFRTHDRRVLVREHEAADWLPRPPMQADADVAITRISKTEVMEERRTIKP